MSNSSRWVPIINGVSTQQGFYTLDEAAEKIAKAHREGVVWDCRVKGEGTTWSVLTRTEQDQLIQAVLEKCKEHDGQE